MRYSSRKLSNDKVITTDCNFWRQIACTFQVMSGNIVFLGNKIFEIPTCFQTRPRDLGKRIHACSLRFSALKSSPHSKPWGRGWGEGSGRKNVLRKLLRILYRRLKAGFSVCWLFDCVVCHWEQVREFLGKTEWNAQGVNVCSSKSLFTFVWFFFFVTWKLLWTRNNQC